MKEGIHVIAKKIDADVRDLINAIDRPEKFYRTFPIKRTRKRPRWIHAPNHLLKDIQRKLLSHFLYQIKPHKAAHGFYPGKSILTNAKPHCSQNWVYSFDVENFFPSTTDKHILSALLKLSCFDRELCFAIVKLCCLAGKLPQGAPTSPHLANLAFYECDLQLESIAKENLMNYTRYADDMTFSGEDEIITLEDQVNKIIKKYHYELSFQKSKRMGKNHRQKVTGLIVNKKVLLPRELRRKIRAIKHDVKSIGLDNAVQKSSLVNSVNELNGYLALEKMLKSEQPI